MMFLLIMLVVMFGSMFGLYYFGNFNKYKNYEINKELKNTAYYRS